MPTLKNSTAYNKRDPETGRRKQPTKRECLGPGCARKPLEKRMFDSFSIGNRRCDSCLARPANKEDNTEYRVDFG